MTTAARTTQYIGQDYATETLVTDTIAYDVMSYTAKTITVRRRRQTDKNRRAPGYDQGPFPVVLTETESDAHAESRVLRLRKDGTYRTHRSGNPLRFTDFPPEVRTDYRM